MTLYKTPTKAKRPNPRADTSKLESEIDQLVAPRQLYEVTEEIDIVEGTW